MYQLRTKGIFLSLLRKVHQLKTMEIQKKTMVPSDGIFMELPLSLNLVQKVKLWKKEADWSFYDAFLVFACCIHTLLFFQYWNSILWPRTYWVPRNSDNLLISVETRRQYNLFYCIISVCIISPLRTFPSL